MEKIVTQQGQISEKLRADVLATSKKAIEEHGAFRIGVSGGSLVKFLHSTVTCVFDSELEKWQIFFCDERYVPEDSEDSTFKAYRDSYPSLEKRMIPIDYNLPLEDCAKDYERKILKAFNAEKGSVPEFDMLLLGMGDDGHTCSLFPGHKLLEEEDKLIAPIDDSPKPPPKRVTMTLPLINSAKRVIFVVTGAGKADVVKRAFIEKEPLPAGLISPKSLKGIFDEGAGAKLGIEPEPMRGN